MKWKTKLLLIGWSVGGWLLFNALPTGHADQINTNIDSINVVTNSASNQETGSSSPANFLANTQVPPVMSSYWNQWRQVKLTQPVQVQQINYQSDTTLKKTYGTIQTLPVNTVIYVKGWQLLSDDSTNAYFMVANSLSDPVAQTGFKTTTPFWATNVNNLAAFHLTANNDAITPVKIKSASIGQFDAQFRQGYLNPENAERPVLMKTASIAQRALKISSLDDSQFTKADRRWLQKVRRASPTINLLNHKLMVKVVRSGIVQIKVAHQLYYGLASDFRPYNTILINAGSAVASTQKPLQSSLANAVIPKGTQVYATNGQAWNVLTIRNGKIHRTNFWYTGQNWLTNQQRLQNEQSNE